MITDVHYVQLSAFAFSLQGNPTISTLLVCLQYYEKLLPANVLVKKILIWVRVFCSGHC